MPTNTAYLKAGRTPESDECLTPRYAVLPIVKYLKEKGFKTIWCPFDMPDSKYVTILRENNFKVFNSHIDCNLPYIGDFLKTYQDYVDDLGIDCIVSNPPFSKKDQILEHLYALDLPFMMLLPQNTLQSIKRVHMFLENGLEYLGFDRRINFYTRGELDAWKPNNHFASGYFCKNVLPEKLIFEKLTPIQEPY